MPFTQINDWLAAEKSLGSSSPERMVLATAGKDGVPHSRIVAIREVDANGILFFTQKGTRKTLEMAENPRASMTLWLPLQQREVMIDGTIQTLSQDENQYYWSTRTKDRQLHFLAYAPTSTHVIVSTDILQQRLQALTVEYQNKDVPLPEYYLGYRLVPETYCFYTLIDAGFSEIIRYVKSPQGWTSQTLSP